MVCTLTSLLNSELPQFKCSPAACGQWLLYWTVQGQIKDSDPPQRMVRSGTATFSVRAGWYCPPNFRFAKYNNLIRLEIRFHYRVE